MVIKNVEVIPFMYDMERPIMDSFCYTNKRAMALVKIETDTGIVGYGEAGSYGGGLHAVIAEIEGYIKPLLIGKDPLNKELIWRLMYKKTYQHGRGGIPIMAMSGVDIALWDITGKAANLPLYQLLGGFTNKVRAYASAGFYKDGRDLDELQDEVRQMKAKGFTAYKMKVGRVPKIVRSDLPILPDGWRQNQTLESDLKRVAAVREAAGPDMDIMVDANSSWDENTAIWMAKRLEDYNLFYIEEPMPTEEIEGSARLAAATTIPIAGYETAYTRYEYRHLIDKRAVDIVQPDPTWCGGISECMKVAAMAGAHNMPVIPHGFSSGVCLAACLHLVGGIANGEMIEFDRNTNPFRTNLINEKFEIDSDGYVHIPDAPGLGITINESFVREHRMKL